MPSDRAAGHGSRDVYGERAETYLRLLAEAALRTSAPKTPAIDPPATEPPAIDSPASSADTAADGVNRAANLLVEAGVLDDTRVAAILLDLTTALRARGRGEPSWTRRHRVRRLAAMFPRRQDSPPPEEWRVFPGPAAVPGARVMAFIVMPDRVLAPATLSFPPSAGIGDLQTAPWAGLAAADGAGTDYRTTFASGSWAGSTWTGTILLRPAPPAGAEWLKIFIPNGFSLLTPVPDPPPVFPAATEAVSDTPGERLLTRHAEALLASLPAGLSQTNFPGDFPGWASPADPPAGDAGPGLAELAGTLEAAGALPELSVVRRQVVALHGLLGLADGTGSEESPGDVPGRWLKIVTHYGRRRHLPPAAGTAAIGARLPELDGVRFAVAGLHSGPAGTHLHVVARGLRPLPSRVPPGLESDAGFSWWLRDDSGGWHLCAITEASPAGAETVLRMAVLPPLSYRTAALTAEVTGVSARVTAAALPVRW